ncbi:hypothetical protein [Cohnella zeiphila]|uniref:rRNA methyltransferase n=1 Tax=Cohnella zeiphila TaxID=2761120 RepID=A0A7X0VUK9_9BACL|nr:hypothetical protein [Cohnella zeiphila]
MDYLFETVPRNYETFASGRVLYNARGTTAFPVRLASEIAQRCFRILEGKGEPGPYSVYDPCCGGGYLLTVVGLLHGPRIGSLQGSDVDGEALGIAAQNLSLLTKDGLDRRKDQLRKLYELYGKTSHREALASAEELDERIRSSGIERIATFQADATSPENRADMPGGVHLVMTDLPYGNLAEWRSESRDPLPEWFETVRRTMIPSRSVLAVVADKGQKLAHGKFRRLQHLKVGKRQIALFEPLA